MRLVGGYLGESQVSEFDIEIIGDQKVFEFEIAVQEVLHPELEEAHANRVHEVFDDWLLAPVGELFDEIREASSGAVFQDHVEIGSIETYVDKFD